MSSKSKLCETSTERNCIAIRSFWRALRPPFEFIRFVCFRGLVGPIDPFLADKRKFLASCFASLSAAAWMLRKMCSLPRSRSRKLLARQLQYLAFFNFVATPPHLRQTPPQPRPDPTPTQPYATSVPSPQDANLWVS